MLIVLASRHDQRAREIAERWKSLDAGLMTCHDLSLPGWRYYPGKPEDSTAVVDGKVVWWPQITGVLTRIPCINPGELTHIHLEDREYVAAEMTSFLTAWLSSLSCPVLNRPTATCLSGPAWRSEQWGCAAAAAGISAEFVQRSVYRANPIISSSAEVSRTAVTVVGNRWFGQVDPTVGEQARRLAAVAGVNLLELWVGERDSGSRVVSVNLWPDLSSTEILEAVTEFVMRASLVPRV